MQTEGSELEKPPVAAPVWSRLDLLLFAAGCGLAGGELEVLARVARRHLSPTNQLYLTTRHFVWIVPLVDLLIVLGVGILAAGLSWAWPRWGGKLGVRLVAALALFPALLTIGAGIYPEAWLILALGAGVAIAQRLERKLPRVRRGLGIAVAVLTLLVAASGGSIVLEQWQRLRQESAAPHSPAGACNVLLVVLDTVRADHLSLYGYHRKTTPNLDALADSGVVFREARAAAPWTLASHATLFTGRWPHELGVRWMHPLGPQALTIAQALTQQGYATAGFVGNTFYCSYDSGLDRGFTHYEDHELEPVSAARSAILVDLTLKTAAGFAPMVLGGGQGVLKLAHGERKGAHRVNHELVRWLRSGRDPSRPFFAFVNYVDAHEPYVLPPGAAPRFSPTPLDQDALSFLVDAWPQIDKTRIPPRFRALAQDAYDDCLAFVDEELGKLVQQLKQQGLFEQTLMIVTADHGEGLGEHDLFDHGESLYRPEIHVPLVVVPPGGRGSGPAVTSAVVSLRDLPATIAHWINPGAKNPFPGQPLILKNAAGIPALPEPSTTPVRSELESPNPRNPNQGRSPAYRGPLVSLVEGNFVYIRNAGDGKEELFDEREDPRELTNRANQAEFQPTLERFRNQIVKSSPPAQ